MFSTLWIGALGLTLGGWIGCGNDGSGGSSSESDLDLLDSTEIPEGGEDEEALAVEPLFLEGCPTPGRATARRIGDARVKMRGPDALGGAGDWLVMNEKAAFIVQDPNNVRTYWYYGGILVDAAALAGCTQVADERFEEFVPLMGILNATQFDASVMRGFRGERAEVLRDGSDGGPAVIRVHGVDDYFWLIELELVKGAFLAGRPKPLSSPLGIKVHMDYILDPGSSVLRLELHVENIGDQALDLLVGTALWFGDDTRKRHFADSRTDVGGYGLDMGVPWLIAENPAGSYAVAIEKANAATVEIAGVQGFLNVDQVVLPHTLAPAGGPDPAASRLVETFFLAVGRGDANSAVRELAAVNPQPVSGRQHRRAPVSGRVTTTSGMPLPHAEVVLELKNKKGEWRALDAMFTDADGHYAGEVADMGDARLEYRLVVRKEGWPRPDPVALQLPSDAPIIANIMVGDAGSLRWRVRDAAGADMPAKVFLWQGDILFQRIYAFQPAGGGGTTPVPPGTYTVSITRGFEYEALEREITITAGQETVLDETLRRLVDTTGYLSFDGHVHAGPSSDSAVSVPMRLLTAAVENLEIVPGTDHEAITDYNDHLPGTGLSAFLKAITGEEVTPPIPEHNQIFMVEPRPQERRGGPPDWRYKDLGEIFATNRERGAKVQGLNHPRGRGCNYLCVIDYDRMTGQPRLDDPTKLGFRADQKLWSFDFHTVEYQNGNDPVFLDPADPLHTGLFDDWMSFHNLGHRITAIAVTDVHDLDMPGHPRVWFKSSTDDPAGLVDNDFVDAMKNGRVVASTGAFARVTANGTASLGDILTDTDGTIDLHVRIEAIPQIDVTHYAVFVNCDQVAFRPTAAPEAVVKIDETIPIAIDRDAHVVVVGLGEKRYPKGFERFDPRGVPRFTTNPIFIDHDGDGRFTPPGGKACVYDVAALSQGRYAVATAQTWVPFAPAYTPKNSLGFTPSAPRGDPDGGRHIVVPHDHHHPHIEPTPIDASRDRVRHDPCHRPLWPH